MRLTFEKEQNTYLYYIHLLEINSSSKVYKTLKNIECDLLFFNGKWVGFNLFTTDDFPGLVKLFSGECSNSSKKTYCNIDILEDASVFGVEIKLNESVGSLDHLKDILDG